MKSNKLLNYIIAGIAIVGIILFIRVVTQDKDTLMSDIDLQNSVVSPLVYFSQILLFASVGIAIILSLLGLFTNPQNLKKTLLSLAVLVVVLIISYVFADSEAVLDAQGLVLTGGEEGSATNQWVGTGIWYSVILLGFAGVFFVVDLVKGLIKS